MPVVTCPKCPTQLKIPDGASGNVKCPKCGNIFPITKPASPFEVVDDSPPKPAPAAGSKSAAALPKPAPAKAEDADFEVVDEKPKKKRYDDDDDYDDDRPRKKKKRYDDDDDDRPRSKKKRYEDDDDDDDDRPRRRKKKRRPADDDDWQPARRGGAFGPAKTGALLLSIGLWLYLAAFGLMALFVVIGWAGGEVPDGMLVIPGLVGLGNWIVSLVGLGFCIAGPARARGMAIAATSVASVHLILLFVCFSNLDSGFRGFGGFGGGSSFGWLVIASVLPALDIGLPLLIYQSRLFGGDFLVAFLAAGCEVARLILIILTLKGLAAAARDQGTVEKSTGALITVCTICGVAAVLSLIVTVIVVEGKLGKSAKHLAPLTFLLIYGGYAFMTIAPALLAKDTKDALADRAG